MSASSLKYKTILKCEGHFADLYQMALEASEKAYAPYSGVKIGAVLELNNGHRVLGNNQENGVFPVGVCAERVALNFIRANQPEYPIKLLVLASSNYKSLLPCGICRQSLVETEIIQSQPIQIFTRIDDHYALFESASELLPAPFVYHDKV